MAGPTLQAGLSNYTLYYSSASSPGYLAGAGLNAYLQTLLPLSEYQYDTTSAGASGTDTATNLPVLEITSSPSTVTASNYSAIIDGAIGPITLDIYNSTTSGGTGTTSVLAGSGGGVIQLEDDSNAVIAAGDGNYWVGGGYDTGYLDVALGDGNDTVNFLYGPSTIVTGSGDSIINLYQGSSIITFDGPTSATPGLGADTVNAGMGSETVDVTGYAGALISENESYLSLTNGDSVTTVRGGGNPTGFGDGGGATTINAGGGTGAVVWLGEDYNFFLGGSTSALATLYDQVTDNSANADTLEGGAGFTSINAAGSTGDVTLVTGTGDSTLVGGSGSDTFEVGELASGSHGITIDNWLAGSSDTLELQGFGGQTDITWATVTGGITASLTDGTVITFTGLTDQDQVTNITSV